MTLVDLAGHADDRHAHDSELLPSEYAWFAARDAGGGEILGAALDGKKLGRGRPDSASYATAL